MESESMHLEDEKDGRRLAKKLQAPITATISEGKKYLRLLKFEKAIACFENILQRNPKNIQSLLGRAKCNMRLGKYKEAWMDFDQVTKLNPKCTEAIYLKGVTEYLRGNFEKGFMTYWHGYQQRPSCKGLRQGYEFCQKAIKNNLRTDAQMILTNKDVENITYVKKKNEQSENKTNSACFRKTDLFYSDLKLLKEILDDENSTSLHPLCRNLSNYLKERQQFWRMQAPCVSANESSHWSFVRKNTDNIMKMNRLFCTFGSSKVALEEGETDICIKKGEEVLEILKSISFDFPEKNEMEAETLHNLVMAYLAEEKFDAAMKYCELQLDIIDENQMQGTKGRVLTDFGEIYHKTNQYEKALQFFRQSLELAKFAEEKAIILYKMADCNVHLNDLKEAREMARRSLDLAIRSQDCRFQIDALLLLAETAVKGKEMKVAEVYYKDALDIALQNKDSRQKDLEYLLLLFEESPTKDSYSEERIDIVKTTDCIRNT